MSDRILTDAEPSITKVKEKLQSQYFIPLGYGEEWFVYIPQDQPLPIDVIERREDFVKILDVYDPEYQPALKLLKEKLTTLINSQNPKVVYKAPEPKSALRFTFTVFKNLTTC